MSREIYNSGRTFSDADVLPPRRARFPRTFAQTWTCFSLVLAGCALLSVLAWRFIPAPAQMSATRPPAAQVSAQPAGRLAGSDTGWYRFSDLIIQAQPRCERAPDTEAPLATVALTQGLGIPFEMEDVTEGGVVVETTMYSAWALAFGLPADLGITWYRTAARREAQLRAARLSAEQEARRQAQDRAKYR